MWASLPCELLVEIFRRLESTAVVRCAGACRPWRRAIIGNASCLHPRPDRFNPNLLIGFFYRDRWRRRYIARLQYVPGQFQDLLAVDVADAPWYKDSPHYTSIGFFVPAAGVDLARYDQPLSSRDGLVLLRGGRESMAASDLCLCNPLAGTCRFLPAAALDARTYVLVVTGHGDDSYSVLAVGREDNVEHDVMIYQIFSSASGEWGPVRRLGKFDKGLTDADIGGGEPGNMVVSHGSIYWLVRQFTTHPRWSARWRVFAMDVRTERTWITELPEKHVEINKCKRLVLATSEEGRLSLIAQQLQGHQIEVWVLGDGGEWTLRRTIDLRNLIPDCLKEGKVHLTLSGFCPRSGCLFGNINCDDLLIDVSTGSLRSVQKLGVGNVTKYPYEMDWSTYISRMKYF